MVGESTDAGSGRRRCILVVADDVEGTARESELLALHGFAPVVVHSGSEAISAVERYPDLSLVLMDIELTGGLDGPSAAVGILARRELPIVFRAVPTRPEAAERVDGVRHDGLVVKGTGEAVLLEAIRRALSRFEADRALRAREAAYRRLFDAAGDAMLLMQGSEFVDCNRVSVSLFGGTSKRDIIGTRPWELSPETQPDGESSRAAAGRYRALAIGGAPQQFEWTHQRLDGTRFETKVSLAAADTPEGAYTLAIVRDIGEQKRVELELRRAVAERDALMQELNHRVKNNLAIVGSLLSLKDRALGEVADLTDVRAQLEAIRAVHDRLSRSDGAIAVEMESYIRQIVETVFGALSGRTVETYVEVDVGTLPAKTAVPVGLIVNEIATNAAKHGFATDEPGAFRALLRADGASYRLVLTNSGRRFPSAVSIENPDSMGLRLVVGLVSQLDGRLDLQREPYPVFTVRFPARPE